MPGKSLIIHLSEGEKVEQWTVMKKLGEGACGAVFLVKDEKNGIEGALKGENIGEKMPLLRMEALVLMELAKGRARHVVELLDKGKHDNFNFIVMKLVGKSLQDMKKTGPDQHLSLGPAISVSIQCLEALEDLHMVGYLHRDVKPGNFCVGRAELKEFRKIYILDFGMSRKYTSNDGAIRKPRSAAQFRGTPRYAPIASHDSRDHSRKEDLESWFYMLIDFSNASLPWKGLNEIAEVGEGKKRARKELPRFFEGCPKKEYKDILMIIDNLQYYDVPPYQKIYDILRKCIIDHKLPEFPYDWETSVIPPKSQEKGSIVKGWERPRPSFMDPSVPEN
ncbi:unnamed protein product, partial [Mesorhabditis belari]|uniref:non-specific serine/threonine protein kinase n=1 Tax=Mesorhabditis belari TaxID=2138241 RepID=A0AAF3EIT5_9BILA